MSNAESIAQLKKIKAETEELIETAKLFVYQFDPHLLKLRDDLNALEASLQEPASIAFRISPPITDIPFRITDSFNAPRNYANKLHEGTDFDAYDEATGSLVPVRAVADGEVFKVNLSYSPPPALSYGLYVALEHRHGDQIYRSWYCHLSGVGALSLGQTVKRGEVVGTSGKSGTSAIHLHLNVQHIGHGLADYFIPDVIDPMSIMDKP